MSLQIDLDPHGRARVPFPDMRSRLQGLGRPFTERELGLLPYNEIAWAATAIAGSAACTLGEVLDEKRRRRERFLALGPMEREAAKGYLVREGMQADIAAELQMRDAPHWDQISPPARLWLKLSCLYTHTDTPDRRLRDVFTLLERCDAGGYLPRPTVSRMVADLDCFFWFYPEVIEQERFRLNMGGFAEELLHRLSPEDRGIARHELVRGYQCTASCFQAVCAST